MGVKKQKLCKICGQPIPDDVAMRQYCSPECKKEGERLLKQQYYQKNKEELYIKRCIRNGWRLPKEKRETGLGVLIAEVVIKAIQDIRAVSLEDVRRYEDPDYWAHKSGHMPNRAMNYLTAKKFLLSERFDTLCGRLSGKDIYNKLIREKEEECLRKRKGR